MRSRDDPAGRPSEVAQLRARLRAVSVWAVPVAVVAFAVTFGLRLWVIVVAIFGLLYAGINRALSGRIAEQFERQPDLGLEVALGDGGWADAPAAARQPWPFDEDAVIKAEMKRLTEEADAFENAAKGSLGLMLRGPMSAPPSASEYKRARRNFEEQLRDHEVALREWLGDYRDLADQYARTFELDLHVTASQRGAYAEDVSLVLVFPSGIEIVDDWPTIACPPEPPGYQAPAPRPYFTTPDRIPLGSLGSPVHVPPISFELPTIPEQSIWNVDDDNSRATISLGSIHHGSSVHIREGLLVRVRSPGRIEIAWTLFAKNSRRHRSGTLTLVVPQPAERPAFRRLHGITSFPDVPLVDDNGDVVRELRADDPPISPPPRPTTTGSGRDSVLDLMLEGREWLEWHELGLAEDEDDDQRFATDGSADGLETPNELGESPGRVTDSG